MPTEIIMPKVDMDMASGKIMTWHVAEGETVKAGEPLFDIETDKAAMEVEAPADGILQHRAPEGSVVPIGKPCGWLYADGEEVGLPPTASKAKVAEAEIAEEDVPALAAEALKAPAIADKVRATPRARAMAAEARLDLATISGTGPRGRIQAEDAQAAIEALKPTTPPPMTPALLPATFQPETGPLSISRSKGGTGMPVVFIHGFASDATSWAPLEGHLKHRPLIRIDLPSHGRSPKLRIDSFPDLVKEMRRAFDDLGLETANLIGHSLGGAVALALADTRPKSVGSLTLIAPAGLGPDVNGAALSGICNASRPESLKPWLRQLVANEDLITDSYVRLAMRGRCEPNLRAAQAFLADALFPDGVQAFDMRAALKRLETPTRIIWGKQDAIIPWKHALHAPGYVGLHLFEGVGHMPHIEEPQALGTVVRSYL